MDLFDKDETIQQAFLRFHSENVSVYLELRDLALEYQRTGVYVGIAHLFEVLRHNRWLRTRGDQFKLNNNYRSRYARLLMSEEPELADYFETRRLTA